MYVVSELQGMFQKSMSGWDWVPSTRWYAPSAHAQKGWRNATRYWTQSSPPWGQLLSGPFGAFGPELGCWSPGQYWGAALGTLLGNALNTGEKEPKAKPLWC